MMRKHLSGAVLVACVAALPLVGSTAASADTVTPQATSCPSSGRITDWDVCTTLTNGILLLSETSDGSSISVSYTKTGGSSVTGKLAYVRSDTVHSSPTLTFSTSKIQEYDWSVGASCASTTGELISGSDVFTTPAAPGC
ncbi:hypothetical protein [Streptomyces sp. NPDC127038]|uniref:hypothetical protein n=1 Tax=Streptomyces sp. NPDC127038 TaxID=3347114 RepID=UPI003647A3F1